MKKIAFVMALITVILLLTGCSAIFEPTQGGAYVSSDSFADSGTAESRETAPSLSLKDTYTSPIKRDYDPTSFYCAGTTFNFNSFPKDDAYYSLLSENADLDVIVTVYAQIKQNGKYESETTFKMGIGPEILSEKDFASNKDTYTDISLSYTVKAKRLLSQGVYVQFFWHDGSVGSYGLVQNIYYTVSFSNSK